MMHLNYLSSSLRRSHNKADYGTHTFQFAEVNCKKDVCEIQAEIAPVVNKGVKTLEGSKLLAIKSGEKIECVFVPKDSEHITTTVDTNTNSICLRYNINSKTITKYIKIPLTATICHWVVIPSFHVVISGDLSFYATATGRDGYWIEK